MERFAGIKINDIRAEIISGGQSDIDYSRLLKKMLNLPWESEISQSVKNSVKTAKGEIAGRNIEFSWIEPIRSLGIPWVFIGMEIDGETEFSESFHNLEEHLGGSIPEVLRQRNVKDFSDAIDYVLGTTDNPA